VASRRSQSLGVNVYALAGWLQGTSDAPDAAYFAALEIVANGPFNDNKVRLVAHPKGDLNAPLRASDPALR
jgi:hypothetical protein